MENAVSFGMWLMLFASVTVAFAAGLLEFIWRDTTDYDMEFLWNYRYTLEDLHLDRKE
ncbi:hypothetical protein [Paenibacillus mucilaginosus]|uniref:Uncharacterized protein n=3 Tax=Paenibacillus mucilaginosus TaxID=61624 RepID=H6NH43_9BACL|nr:hypothetical protein [Paenibacillus mucilaginosus]AEI40068.1 hypothetical protein KNP414_01504 [Paenibacillus mucilaginosus KNP414]AFC28721.1 hypothetical protein PM3016_1811 [Paenibacillus mucilaginosus 3016]AFH60899.1 hypothetical protein B2K_09225 [Paenibacillus mucilaginosus K02]MCG7215675.1 hypothetical protein [Paenibacillus mucilaginosus]WDM29307.1 hypothetical protein KCX80_09185 [Paenibacillus mucilaginosus]